MVTYQFKELYIKEYLPMSFKVQTNMKVLTTRLEEPKFKVDEKYYATCNKIRTYLLSNRNAIAIASNQLFSNHRVFGMWYEGKIKLFVNPRVLSTHSDFVKELEGCMSISNGNKKYLVGRRTQIFVFSDNHGEEQYSNYDARVIQHEIDHLEGWTIKCRYEEQN